MEKPPNCRPTLLISPQQLWKPTASWFTRSASVTVSILTSSNWSQATRTTNSFGRALISRSWTLSDPRSPVKCAQEVLQCSLVKQSLVKTTVFASTALICRVTNVSANPATSETIVRLWSLLVEIQLYRLKILVKTTRFVRMTQDMVIIVVAVREVTPERTVKLLCNAGSNLVRTRENVLIGWVILDTVATVRVNGQDRLVRLMFGARQPRNRRKPRNLQSHQSQPNHRKRLQNQPSQRSLQNLRNLRNLQN